MEKAPKPSAASTTWFGRRETSMNLTKKADPLLPANTFTGAGRRVGITRTEGEKKKKKIQSRTQVQRYRYLDAGVNAKTETAVGRTVQSVSLCEPVYYGDIHICSSLHRILDLIS